MKSPKPILRKTEWQEQGAREAAWKLAKSVLKLKEHERAIFFSPSENRCLPASTIKLEEREFVVDSGASMHMISKKDLSNTEMDTLTKSCSPTIVITANGEVQTNEEATVYVKELDILDWKSSKTRQQHCRSESFAMKTDILMNGSMVKNHISLKTGVGYKIVVGLIGVCGFIHVVSIIVIFNVSEVRVIGSCSSFRCQELFRETNECLNCLHVWTRLFLCLSFVSDFLGDEYVDVEWWGRQQLCEKPATFEYSWIDAVDGQNWISSHSGKILLSGRNRKLLCYDSWRRRMEKTHFKMQRIHRA